MRGLTVRSVVRPALVLLTCLSAATAAAQDQFTVLKSFENVGSGLTFVTPGSDGVLYGVAQDGGPSGGGIVFAVTPAGALTVLHGFGDGTAGRRPTAPLVEGADGAFYGTAEGGPAGAGVLYRVTAAGAFTVVHAFDGGDGMASGAPLLRASDGTLYGVSPFGGLGFGTVFAVAPDGTFSVAHAFTDGDGAYPMAALVQGGDGAIYGTTNGGGPNGAGTVFRLDAGGTLSVLRAFAGVDGANPQAPLLRGADDAFYGTTASGGSAGAGTVFRIAADGAFTMLHEFQWSDGFQPAVGLTQGLDGLLYGVAQGGAFFAGTVFAVAPTGGLTTIHTFNGADGRDPSARLTAAADGSLYGVTASGGPEFRGSVFRITSGILTTIRAMTVTDGSPRTAEIVQGTDGRLYGGLDASAVYAVDGDTVSILVSLLFYEGRDPASPLVFGPDGAVYGTTTEGGAFGGGIIFKVTPAGAVSTVHSFSRADATRGLTGLVAGADGVYGITISGGTFGLGSVFRLGADGVFTTLHSFDDTSGAFPWTAMTAGPDGAFYGIVASGGQFGLGGIFRITPSGAQTLLHSFAQGEGSPGPSASGGLSLGSDGALYGAAMFGTFNGDGTVFRITPDGAFSLLHVFSGADGRWPAVPPVPGADGAVYGTTTRGGAFNAGTVYRLTADGTFTLLHEFTGVDGEDPAAMLITGADGALYGTTRGGFLAGSQGSVFKVDTGGAVSLLHTFTGADGASVAHPLVSDETGTLHGITQAGGPSGAGTIFSLSTDGTLTSRYAFDGSTGAAPFALVATPGGTLFGTARAGGPSGGGTVFRLTTAAPQDTIPPTVVATVTRLPNAAGWYNADVVVTFTCSDAGGAGIPEGACPPDQVLSSEGASERSTSVTVTDGAGNVSAPSNVVDVRIDKTAPALSPAVLPARVHLRGTAEVTPNAGDALSGLESATCGPLDTTAIGPRTLTCVATDLAGNVASAQADYTVVYRVDGFLQPINDPAGGACAMSVFKSRSTVVARVRLMDAAGTPVFSASLPEFTAAVVGTTNAPVNEAVDRSRPTPGTSFRLVGDHYVYRWDTTAVGSRRVVRLGIRLDDGQTYTVDIGVR